MADFDIKEALQLGLIEMAKQAFAEKHGKRWDAVFSEMLSGLVKQEEESDDEWEGAAYLLERE